MNTARKSGSTELPDGWRLMRLGDVADVRSGIGFPIDRQGRETGTYPFIKVSDMNLAGNEKYIRFANNYVEQLDAAELGGTPLPEGTVIFPKVGAAIATNKKRILTTPTLIDNNMVGISLVSQEICDSRYLFYWFETVDLSSFANVSAVPSITGSRLKEATISLPPLHEQFSIADVLDSIDEAIERTEAVITATQTLSDSLLHDLLTHGVPGWHTEWKDVPGIGTIPADWEVVRLGEVIETSTYGTNEPLGDNGNIVVLRMNNIRRGEIDWSDVKRAELSEKELNELDLQPGDILFNRTNSLDLVGKIAMIRDLPEPTSFASYLVRIRTKAERALPIWSSALLGSNGYQSRIRRFATPGVSQANINPTSLKSLTIPLPSISEQANVIAVLDGIREQMQHARHERDSLGQAKSAIADALLSGRMRGCKIAH